MNTVKVFAEGVAKQIHGYLPAEYGNVQCEIQENLKNNGVRLVGIEFHKPDSTVSPVLYMESYYEDMHLTFSRQSDCGIRITAGIFPAVVLTVRELIETIR